MRKTKESKNKEKALRGQKIMEGNILPAETFRKALWVVAFKLEGISTERTDEVRVIRKKN